MNYRWDALLLKCATNMVIERQHFLPDTCDCIGLCLALIVGSDVRIDASFIQSPMLSTEVTIRTSAMDKNDIKVVV
jgi:hypothetical protein